VEGLWEWSTSVRLHQLPGGLNPAGALNRGKLNPRSFYHELRLRGNGPAAELDSADLDSASPSGTPIYM